MAFPDDDLDIAVDAAFGADLTAAPSTWQWTDLTSRILSNPITVTQGVVVGTGTTRTASASGLTMLNDDGYLTPLLATSPYWPFVDVGTPIRLRVRSDTTAWLSDDFTRTVSPGWGVASSGQNWVGTTNLSVNGSAGRMSFPVNNSFIRARVFRPHLDADVLFDTSIAAVSTGAANTVGPMLRSNSAGTDYIWPTVEFGLAGTVRWTVRTVQANVFTGVADTGTLPGLTYSAGTLLRARVQLIGRQLRARVWLAAGTEPTNWQVDVDLGVLTTSGNYVGIQAWCVGGNTNTLPNPISVDNLTVGQPRYPRIDGFIADVRPTFVPLPDGSTHSVVQIDIGGIGSRLERRKADPWGPMRRSIQLSSVPPIAYWPLEDAKDSTSAASAFPGVDPMAVNGPAVFDFDTGTPDDLYLQRYGSTALCSIAAGAKLTGVVPQSATASEWTVSGSIDQWVPGIGGGVTELRMLECATPSGTHTRWALVRTLTGHVVRAYNDPAGTVTDVITFANLLGYLLAYDVTAEQVGGNVQVTLYIGAKLRASGSVAGTLGPVTRVTVNPDRVNTTGTTDPFGIRFIAGHIAVHDQALTAALPFYFDGSQALRADQGWGYEKAHRRLLRLCTEERVPCTVLGDPYTTGTTSLNVQQEGAFVDLITAAADADSGGLLYEAGFGYAHVPRTSRYNRPADLVIDMATYCRDQGTDPTDVLVPKLDARGPNYWTVERTHGSSGSYAADEAYRQRRGTIAEKATLDVLYDSDTAPHAQWRTHLYVDGQQANYPSMTVDLAANPDLAEDWLRCSIGARVQRINQPTIAGYGAIDQVVDGIVETIAPRTFQARLDCSPAGVWDTGVWDTPGSVWSPSNTVLTSGVSSTATSWSMNSGGQPWITGAVSLLAQVGAEYVTITNISGSGSSYTFTVTRSVNGVVASHVAGAQLTFVNPARWGL